MEEKNYKDIIEAITKNEKKILRKLNAEDFEVYRFLRKEYEKGNILNNLVFQFVYRNHYRLENGGLSDKQKNEYFKLMKDNVNDLSKILYSLYCIPNKKDQQSFQFSFATKLIHFLDIKKPIWDNRVKTATGLELGDNKSEYEVRVESSIRMYKKLIRLHKRLLKDEGVMKFIAKIRYKHNLEFEYFSDVKILDMILWWLGNFEFQKENERRKKRKKNKLKK